MRDFGNNLTQKCVSTRVRKENEARQLFGQICAKDFFPEQEPAEMAFYGLEILAIVQKTSSLPNGSLIEDRCHSLDEPIVKRSRLHNDTLLLLFSSFVSGFSVN